MLAEQRHQYILAQVAKNGALSVAELVRELNVSRETIRRDLNTLAAVACRNDAWRRAFQRAARARPGHPRSRQRRREAGHRRARGGTRAGWRLASSSIQAVPPRPWRAR